jgi:hypothetical protein
MKKWVFWCNVGISKHIVDQGWDIYFGHKDKVYVINKQLIVDVFRVCAKGYVEEPKWHVNKSLAIQTLQISRLALVILFVN